MRKFADRSSLSAVATTAAEAERDEIGNLLEVLGLAGIATSTSIADDCVGHPRFDPWASRAKTSVVKSHLTTRRWRLLLRDDSLASALPLPRFF